MKSVLLYFFSVLFSAVAAQAADISASGSSRTWGFSFEPMVGYEQVYRSTPTAHTVNRITYGARATLGTERLSAELEYSMGQDSETFSTAPQKITNKDDQIKLGVKTLHSLNQLFYLTGRAGGQGLRNIRETTTNGALTSVESPIKYAPYAGASIGIRFAKRFTADLGTTIVFNDLGDFQKNQYQNTLSITAGFN